MVVLVDSEMLEVDCWQVQLVAFGATDHATAFDLSIGLDGV